MTDQPTVLRQHAEQAFAVELEALRKADADSGRTKPPSWKLSPWAVSTYLLGGKLPNGFGISAKYIGNARLIEIAIATLATDRALLLFGVPGTAKTWVSEHLAAAISDDSTLLVQGTAGTAEEAMRYGWNYAQLLAEGPSRDALVASPMLRAMATGAIARIEELTRIPADVQDTLITILSEKTLPIPELGEEIAGGEGLQRHRDGQQPRPRGERAVHRAGRRFNTVVLPRSRHRSRRRSRSCPSASSRSAGPGTAREPPALEEIRRVVTVFRELRSGVTDDGKTKIKTPSGTLSPAEAISVVTGGIALAAHFTATARCARPTSPPASSARS